MEGRGSLLRERDFRLVAGSVGLSALGDWVAIVALGLQVRGETESGLLVALLWICLFGPSVAVAGHAGLLVDRFEARTLLALVSCAGVAVSLALAISDSVVVLLLLTVLLGVVFAISQPAEFALVPKLAGADRVQEANGHVETSRYIGFAVGPIAGGALVALGGFEAAILLDAATFAAVALAALSLRVRRPPERLADGEQKPRASEGIRYLFADRLLALVMVIAFVSLLFMSAVWVGELFFVTETLGKGGFEYGLFGTTWTAGMMLGALLISPRVRVGAIATAGLGAVAVQGAGLALPTLWLAYGFLLAGAAVGGVAHGLKNVMFRTLIHERTPERLHGRAFAAYNGVRNAAELGAFAAGGVLVAAIGARGTLAFAGGLSALTGLAGLLYLTRLPGHSRRVTTEPLAAATDAELEAAAASPTPAGEPS